MPTHNSDDESAVRLVAISQPVIDDIPGPSELLAFCARVSSTANQMNHETGPRLLQSLVARKEWSPLEMVSLTMEISTTRDIARQILRHRSFSFQEFSQRYAKVESDFVTREARLQDSKDRQNSIASDDGTLATWWRDAQIDCCHYAHCVYDDALERGIAKEVARAILPEGMTRSRLYMAGTLRSWIHYCALRSEYKTQKEHRLIAEQVRAILAARFPDLAAFLTPSALGLQPSPEQVTPQAVSRAIKCCQGEGWEVKHLQHRQLYRADSTDMYFVAQDQTYHTFTAAELIAFAGIENCVEGDA